MTPKWGKAKRSVNRGFSYKVRIKCTLRPGAE